MVDIQTPGVELRRFACMGVARIFFRGGGEHLFQKNFQKIFKKFCKNFQKIPKKSSKTIKKFHIILKKNSKIFKKILKKITNNALF